MHLLCIGSSKYYSTARMYDGVNSTIFGVLTSSRKPLETSWMALKSKTNNLMKIQLTRLAIFAIWVIIILPMKNWLPLTSFVTRVQTKQPLCVSLYKVWPIFRGRLCSLFLRFYIGSTLWLLQPGIHKMCRYYAHYFCCFSLAHRPTRFYRFKDSKP